MCIRILMNQKFQRKPFNFDFPRFSNWCFRKSPAVSLVSGSEGKTFLLHRMFQWRNCRIVFLESESWQSESSKKYLDFARFSNFYFSATTFSSSSIKISIDNMVFVNKLLTEKSLISAFHQNPEKPEIPLKTFFFIFSRSSSWHFPKVTGVISSIMVRVENFPAENSFAMKELSFVFIASESRLSENSKIHNFFARYSNLYSSVLSSSNSSIRNSV